MSSYWEKTAPDTSCPLCEHGHEAEEMISVPVHIYPFGSHEPQVLRMKRSTYERLLPPELVQRIRWLESQRQAARRFRYSRMVYKGAHHGKR